MASICNLNLPNPTCDTSKKNPSDGKFRMSYQKRRGLKVRQRHSKFTPERVRQIEALVARGATCEQIAAVAGLVGEPDLYCIAVDALLARDRLQTGGETFLKSSIAPAA